MADRKPYAATNDNLIEHALGPAMRDLVAAALDGSTKTYGELKNRLEIEAGFSTIFPTRIGFVAGALMEKIQKVQPSAPLINVLVVNQRDGQPAEGAGSFMASRFGDPRLALKGAKHLHPKLWKQSFDRAAGEVYRFTKAEWAALFERVFAKPLNIEALKAGHEQGTEEDGVSVGRNYGVGGEGPFHKALRLWVMDNPAKIDNRFRDATTETEVDLDSGDRVDVIYNLVERTIVIEVKSRISNDHDLRRGVFQCVKYRAVRQATDVRSESVVEAILVTEAPLPGGIAALVKRHNIRHFQAPLDRG